MARSVPHPRRTAGRLDLEAIVDAGLELAAEPGTTGLRVRDLGARLGSDPSTIYRHVASKDHLLRILLDRITGIAIDRIEAPIDDWRAYLRESAIRTLEVFLEYPAIGAEATRLSSGGVNERRIVNQLLEAFRRAGLDDAECVKFYGIWAAFVLSFSAGSAHSRLEHDREAPDPPWFESRTILDPAFPEIVRLHERLDRVSLTRSFVDGIDLILDSAAGSGRAHTGES